jgi:hypothetical protein
MRAESSRFRVFEIIAVVYRVSAKRVDDPKRKEAGAPLPALPQITASSTPSISMFCSATGRSLTRVAEPAS